MLAIVGKTTALISVLITFLVCSIYVFHIQEYQKQMEAFDQNVANVTTWMYRAEILLDESDKQKPQQKEEILKVKKITKMCSFLDNRNSVLKKPLCQDYHLVKIKHIVKILLIYLLFL